MLNSGKTKKGLSANLRKTPLMFILLSAAALLVLLAASAGTGIIGINLLLLHNGSGRLLLFVEFLSGLFVKDIVPLFQILQPVGFCCYHVLVQKSLIEA